MTNIILLIYGVLMIVGGIMGFKKANSKMSLIMGIISGIVIFVGVAVAQNIPKCGYGIITLMTGLLIVVFIIRLIKTKKFMPSGMILILSIVAFAISLCQMLSSQ